MEGRVTRAERRVRYAVRRRLCWACFIPLQKRVTEYAFFCECGKTYPANTLFLYEDEYGRVE